MGRKTVALGVAALGAVSVGALVARGLRGPSRLPAVPEELTTRAEVPGIPRVRYWVGVDIERFVRDVLEGGAAEPLDVAVPEPRLSWQLPGVARQYAYQRAVAAEAAGLGGQQSPADALAALDAELGR